MTLEGLGELILSSASAAVGEACQEICQTARTLCPVDSGELRQSLSASSGDGENGLSAAVSAGAFYAGMVELGTWKQHAQPYLEPAFAQTKGTVVANIVKRIRAGL